MLNHLINDRTSRPSHPHDQRIRDDNSIISGYFLTLVTYHTAIFVMFSLLYGLWRYMTQKDEYSVVIVGLDNSGKTTFLEQTKVHFNPGYKGMDLSRITTTVGLNVGSIGVSGAQINFWDLGGQSELRMLWDKVCFQSRWLLIIISVPKVLQ